MRIADVIKYEGDNSTFIWKHPVEDFNSMTQLIVHESQEAIFFMNGQALDLFGAGRYTLETQNIPIIARHLNRAAGNTTPFHCEVYFINKAEQMAIKWGTDSKVQYIEPTYGFPIVIGASGEMSLRAEDSRKLLVKLVGTEAILEQQKLVSFFRAFLMTRIKTYIAQYMKNNTVSIFELDEHLTLFSEQLHQKLIPDFADYGVSLERFFVTNIVKPDGDHQYEQFKELQTIRNDYNSLLAEKEQLGPFNRKKKKELQDKLDALDMQYKDLFKRKVDTIEKIKKEVSNEIKVNRLKIQEIDRRIEAINLELNRDR